MSGKSTLNIGVNVQPLINETEIRTTIQKKFNQLPATSIKIEPDIKSFNKFIQDTFTKEYPISVTADIGNLETVRTQINDEIDKINNDSSISKVKIDIDSKGFAENLSKNIKDNLKDFNKEIKDSLKNLTLNSVAINTALNGFFPEGKEMSKLVKQAELYQKENNKNKTSDLDRLKKAEDGLFKGKSTDKNIAINVVKQRMSILQDILKEVANFDDIFVFDDGSGLNEDIVKERLQKIVSYYDEVYSYIDTLLNNLDKKGSIKNFIGDIDDSAFATTLNYLDDLNKYIIKIKNYFNGNSGNTDIDSFFNGITNNLDKLRQVKVKDKEENETIYNELDFSDAIDSLTKLDQKIKDAKKKYANIDKTKNEILKSNNLNIGSNNIDRSSSSAIIEVMDQIAQKQGEITSLKENTLTADAKLKISMDDQLAVVKHILEASQKIKNIWAGPVENPDEDKLINGIGQNKVEESAQTTPKDTLEVLKRLQENAATITNFNFDINTDELQKSVNEIFKNIKAPVALVPTLNEASNAAIDKSSAPAAEMPSSQPVATEAVKPKRGRKKKATETPTAKVETPTNVAVSSETVSDIGTGKISKITFDVDQKTLQASVDALFEKIQALIKNIKLSADAVESIQNQIQEAANKEVSISATNVTVDKAATTNKNKKQKTIDLDNIIGVISNLDINPNSESIAKIQQGLNTFANNFTLTIPNITVNPDSIQNAYKQVADALTNVPISFSTNGNNTIVTNNTPVNAKQISTVSKPIEYDYTPYSFKDFTTPEIEAIREKEKNDPHRSLRGNGNTKNISKIHLKALDYWAENDDELAQLTQELIKILPSLDKKDKNGNWIGSIKIPLTDKNNQQNFKLIDYLKLASLDKSKEVSKYSIKKNKDGNKEISFQITNGYNKFIDRILTQITINGKKKIATIYDNALNNTLIAPLLSKSEKPLTSYEDVISFTKAYLGYRLDDEKSYSDLKGILKSVTDSDIKDTLIKGLHNLLLRPENTSENIETLSKQIANAFNIEIPTTSEVISDTIDTIDNIPSNSIDSVNTLKETIEKGINPIDIVLNVTDENIGILKEKIKTAIDTVDVSNLLEKAVPVDTSAEQPAQTVETTKPKKSRRSKKSKAESVKNENWDNFEQLSFEDIAKQNADKSENNDKSVTTPDYSELISGIKSTLDEFLTKLSSITITTTSATNNDSPTVEVPANESIDPKIVNAENVDNVISSLNNYQQKMGELIVAQELLMQWTDELTRSFTEQNIALAPLVRNLKEYVEAMEVYSKTKETPIVKEAEKQTIKENRVKKISTDKLPAESKSDNEKELSREEKKARLARARKDAVAERLSLSKEEKDEQEAKEAAQTLYTIYLRELYRKTYDENTSLLDWGEDSIHHKNATFYKDEAQAKIDSIKEEYDLDYNEDIDQTPLVIWTENELKRKYSEKQETYNRAKEKKIVDQLDKANTQAQKEADKKIIANEKEYLSLLEKEVDLTQKLNEARRRYGEDDERTLNAREELELNKRAQQGIEDLFANEGVDVYDIDGYQETVDRAKRKSRNNELNAQDKANTQAQKEADANDKEYLDNLRQRAKLYREIAKARREYGNDSENVQESQRKLEKVQADIENFESKVGQEYLQQMPERHNIFSENMSDFRKQREKIQKKDADNKANKEEQKRIKEEQERIKKEQEYLNLIKQEPDLIEKAAKARRNHNEDSWDVVYADDDLEKNRKAQKEFKDNYISQGKDVTKISGYQAAVDEAFRKKMINEGHEEERAAKEANNNSKPQKDDDKAVKESIKNAKNHEKDLRVRVKAAIKANDNAYKEYTKALADAYENINNRGYAEGEEKPLVENDDTVIAKSKTFTETSQKLNDLSNEAFESGVDVSDILTQYTEASNDAEKSYQERIDAENESIKVQEKEKRSLQELVTQLQKYKQTLSDKKGGMEIAGSGEVLNSTSAALDLQKRLADNPDGNKNQIAVDWAQANNISGITNYAEAIAKIKTNVSEAKNVISDFNRELVNQNQTAQKETRLNNLKSQLYDYLRKNPKVSINLADEVSALQGNLNSSDAIENTKELGQELSSLRAKAKETGAETENLVEQFANLFSQHLSTAIVMGSLNVLRQSLMMVYQNILQVDTALTELKKITDLSGSSLSEYMTRAAESAQKLGVSLSAYINSTADWKRLGYNNEDAENLATYSTLLANVGDSIDDVNTASSYLITTLQGFSELSADNVEQVIDTWDAVANTQPITAGAIGEILTRSASAMSAANNTFEETIALGTAAYSVVQNAESVGTSLKTISMYLRAASTEAEEEGIATDGMAESTAKLRAELKSLTGVDIMEDAAGTTFKSTYEILKEISAVWNKLTDVSQANVTNLLGGKRNANTISALLENFDVAESSIESAANSAGTAWAENETYLDSIQGRLNQLSSSFQALSVDILDSGIPKFFISLATAVTKGADALIKFGGVVPTAVGVGTTIAGLVNNNSSKAIYEKFDGTVKGAKTGASLMSGTLSSLIPKFSFAGNLGVNGSNKIKLSDNTEDIEDYVAQLAEISNAQRNLVMSATDMSKEVKAAVEAAFGDTSSLKKYSGALVKAQMQSQLKGNVGEGTIDSVLESAGFMSNGKFSLVDVIDINGNEKALEQLKQAIELNDSLKNSIAASGQSVDDFAKQILAAVGMEQSDIVVKGENTIATYAYATAVNFAKEAALGFAGVLLSWAISKAIDWVTNLKTHIEELNDVLNNAKEANKTAQSEVDEIQTKIDELNASLEEAGMSSIDNIVDPDEKGKIESINSSLETQLELKQKLADENANAQNDAAAAVYNEDTIKSIKKGETVTIGNELTGTSTTQFIGEDVTKAESLREYSTKLKQLTDDRNAALASGDDTTGIDTEIEDVKAKLTSLGSEVSSQVDNFDTDAPNFSEYKDEYDAATAAMAAANEALDYENGNVSISSLSDEIVANGENKIKNRPASYVHTVGVDTGDYTPNDSFPFRNYTKYGNIDNTNRQVLQWTDENKKKYAKAYKESGEPEGYSTALSANDEFENVGQIAYSLMLQTESGAVPLTSSEITNYLNTVIQKASKMEGGATPENILAADATGFETEVNGQIVKVSNMVAAVEGQIVNGAELTATDVAAIAGSSASELISEFGTTSSYLGHSMHDIQDIFTSGGNSAEEMVATINSQIADLDTDKLFELMNNDGEGLDVQGVNAISGLWELMADLNLDNSKDDLNTFIAALQKLGYVSEAVTEDINTTKDAITGAIDGLDDMQSGYQTCASAVEEYNKNGYVSLDTLQSLIDLEPQYMSMLEMQDGQLQINGQTVETLTDTYIELAKAELLANTLTEIANTNSLTKAQQVLGQVQAVTGDATAQIIAAGNKAAEEAYSADGFEGYVKAREAHAQILKNYKLQSSLFDDLSIQSPDKIWGSGDSSSSSSSSSGNTALDVWSTLTDAMEEYNTQGYITINTLKSLTDLEDKYTSLLTKNDTTGQLEMRTDAFKQLMMAELKAAQVSGDGASEKRYGQILEWVTDNIDDQTISFYELKTAIEGYSASLDDAAEKVEKMQSLWSNTKTANSKIANTARAGALDYEGTQAQISALDTVRQYSQYDPELFSKVYNSDANTLNLSQDTLKTAVVNSLKEAAKAAGSENTDAARAMAAAYGKAASDIENNIISVQDYFEGLGSRVNEISEEIDDFQSAWTDMSDVAEEYNIYGGVSVDSMQKLLTLSTEYLDCLSLENGYLSVNNDLLKEKLLSKLKDRAIELELKDETKEQAEILRALIAQISENGVNAIKGMTTEADKLETVFSNIKDLFSSLLDLINSVNENNSNDLSIEADAWLDVIDKRIDALNEENDAQERALELQKLQDAYDEAKANKTVRVYTSNGYEWQADASAVKDAETELSDKKRSNKKEDEIEKLEKLKEKIQEVTDAAGSSWEDYQKKLAYTEQFQNMSLSDMEGHLTSYKDSVTSNMKAIQAATDVSEIIDNLTTFIETLEKVNDVINLLGSNGQSSGDGGFSSLFNNLKSTFTNDSGDIDISGGFSKVFDKIKTAADKGFSSVSNVFKKGWNSLFGSNTTTALTTGETKITSNFSNFFSKLGSKVSTSLSSIGSFFSEAWTGIASSTSALVGDIGSFFSTCFSNVTTIASGGLSTVVSTITSLFTPIANGALSIGSAIGSGIVSFFPSIFAGLGTLVTTVGTAMEGMMTAIGTALAAIPVAGWVAAAAVAVAAVALIATLVSVASNVSNTDISEPTPSFTAKKYAKGTRGVKSGQIANVDEEGEEIIVRSPDSGRMTYLEKGDGVIPSDTTDNLMELGENPTGFIQRALGQITGSKAVAVTLADEAEDASDTDSTVSEVKESSGLIGAAIIDSFGNTWGTVKTGVDDTLSYIGDKFSDFSPLSLLGGAVSFLSGFFGNAFGFTSNEPAIESTSDLLDSISSDVDSTMESMRSAFEDTWNEIAKETGLDSNAINNISSSMFSKMQTLVDNTLGAIKSNSSLTTEQVTQLTQKMFDSMASIYSAGWQKAYNTANTMSEETATAVNNSYTQAKTDCSNACENIQSILMQTWATVGGGAELTAEELRAQFGDAWDGTSDDAAQMMQDLNDCFDPEKSAVTQGINNYKDYIITTAGNGWTSIQSGAATSTNNIDDIFGNAWDNGTNQAVSNYADNIKWAMEERFNAINDSCDEMVNKVNTSLDTANKEFEAEEKNITDNSTEEKTETSTAATTTTTDTSSSSDGSKLEDAAHGAIVGGAIGGPFGAIAGAILGFCLGGHANGVKDVKRSHYANVDEQGQELVVRQPASGRYTYLETGDGVVPADITSRLFEMGGNPNGWFHDQMSKYGSQQIVTSGGDNVNVSMGNIIVNNPVGSGNDLANELMRELPNAMAQRLNKRT